MRQNLKGLVFGRLTVLKMADKDKWECVCNCGIKKNIYSYDLINGKTKSCGCYNRESSRKRHLKHGMKGTRFYSLWLNMKTRCNNTNRADWKNYGGRGITICERWLQFLNFRDDMYEKYLFYGKKFWDKKITLERIDVNKNYSKDNCTFCTSKDQNNNKRNNRFITYQNKTLTVPQWSETTGLSKFALYYRFYKKWSIVKMLTTPVKKHTIYPDHQS